MHEVDRLIQKLEIFANRYRLGLFVSIGLGYIYILFTIAFFCFYIYNWQHIFSDPVPVRIVVNLLLFSTVLFSLLKLFTIELLPPAGIDLDLQSPVYSELKDYIDRLLTNHSSQSIAGIIIDRELSIAVVQIPRWGMLGKNQNLLTIGLPLMLALTPSQFEAILSYELAHLSTKKLRWNNWIVGIVNSYQYLLNHLIKFEAIDLLFTNFWKGYIPFLDRYSLPLRRRNESHLDKLAAKIAGTKYLAEALVSIEIYRQFLAEDFWAKIYQNDRILPEPSDDIFDRMEIAIANDCHPESMQIWLKLALDKSSDCLDSRPSLKGRLLNLGYTETNISTLVSSINVSQNNNAARKYFGNSCDRLVDRLNQIWKAENIDRWQRITFKLIYGWELFYSKEVILTALIT